VVIGERDGRATAGAAYARDGTAACGTAGSRCGKRSGLRRTCKSDGTTIGS
jgi:hypothetical protein